MSSIFISHSSKDKEATEAMAQYLQSRGFRSLFLDFDPEVGIPAGSNWEQELYRKLHDCRAVVLLCSEHSMTSDWCLGEIIYARARGKHLFPVVIAPCTLRSILKNLQVIDLTENQAEGYDRLLAGLKHAGLDPTSLRVWQGDRPPYPGLMAFEEADAPVFFGRDRSVREGVDSLIKMRRYGTSRLLMFLGASGCGKSSVVKAGLIPRLKRDPRWLVVEPFRPRDNPHEELAVQLSRMFSRFSSDRPWEELLGDMHSNAQEPWICTIARNIRQVADAPNATVIITIDQFEELLGAEKAQATKGFLPFLCRALDATDNRLLVIGTMRSDFLGTFQNHPVLAKIRYKSLHIPPLTVDDFSQVISGPAEVAGIELEQGLVEALVQDTSTADALPLLAFALRELWEKHGSDFLLTKAQYKQDLGGLEGSIRQVANDVLSDMALTASQFAALQRSLRRLVRINEEGQYTRQVVLRQDLPEESQPILQRLVEARLLVAGKQRVKLEPSSPDLDSEEQDTLEVAHEALFRAWDLFKDTLAEDRGFLLWAKRLRAAIRNWEHARKDKKALLSGSQLAEAKHFYRTRSEDLTDAECHYIKAGMARSFRQKGTRVAVVSLIVALAGGIAIVQWRSKQQISVELSQKQWLMAISERDEKSDWLKSALHLVSAATLQRGNDALEAAVMLNGGTQLKSILSHGKPISGAALSASGSRILLWGRKGSLSLWNAKTQRQLYAIQHDAAIRQAWFNQEGEVFLWDKKERIAVVSPESPASQVRITFDGGAKGKILTTTDELVLTRSESGIIQLWNCQTSALLNQTESRIPITAGAVNTKTAKALLWRDGEDKALLWDWEQSGDFAELVQEDIAGGEFSPDGRRVFTWDISGNVQAWDSYSGAAYGDPFSHQMSIQKPKFSNDGGRFLIWGRDRMFLRETVNFRLETALKLPFNLGGASLSPDGRRILTWQKNGEMAHQRDHLTGSEIAMPLAHEALTRALFFPDLTHVLTIGEDGSARIWSINEAPALFARKVPDAGFDAVAFTDEKRRIVTVNKEKVQTWDLSGEQPTIPVDLEDYRAQSPPHLSLSISGKRVLGWNAAGISIWDSATGKKISEYRVETHRSNIARVEFDPSGHHAALWSDRNRIRLWNGQQGREETTLLPGIYINAWFSSDGKWLFTRPENNRVQVWDADRQELLATLAAVGAIWNEKLDLIISWDSHSDGNVTLLGADGRQTRNQFATNFQIKGLAPDPVFKQVLVWGAEGVAGLWDISGPPVRRTLFRPGEINQAVFSKTGDRILTWGRKELRIWTADTGRPLSPLLKSAENIRSAELSDDERYLLIRNDHQVLIWDLAADINWGSDPALAQQIACGCRLNTQGEIELLSAREWQELKENR